MSKSRTARAERIRRRSENAQVEAEAARERIKGVEPSEGFGPERDEIEKRFRAGILFFEKKANAEALAAFEAPSS